MNSKPNQYPNTICIITYSRKTFWYDISDLEVKWVYANGIGFQLFWIRKVCALEIQVTITVWVTNYSLNSPRMILEILRKWVWPKWKITQFMKELLREKNWKRIVKMEVKIKEMQVLTKSKSFLKKPLT